MITFFKLKISYFLLKSNLHNKNITNPTSPPNQIPYDTPYIIL